MNAKEAALYIGVNERTIRRWIHSGDLPASQTGRVFDIKIRDIEDLAVRKRLRIIGVTEVEDEIGALSRLCDILESMNDAQRDRVLAYLVNRFDRVPPAIPGG